MRARCRRLFVLLAFVAAGSVVTDGGAISASESPRADEYRVKAAFLYNFAKFVDWPAEAFATPAAPLNVCILGVDPFGSALDQALQGHVGNRAIVTRRLTEVEPGCHLVFISASERKRLALLADSLRALRVLTVSDAEGFGGLGGMIELFTEGESVRFNIYPSEVERAGLRASARLIELAANQKHAAGGRR